MNALRVTLSIYLLLALACGEGASEPDPSAVPDGSFVPPDAALPSPDAGALSPDAALEDARAEEPRDAQLPDSEARDAEPSRIDAAITQLEERTLNATIVVEAGATFDGTGVRFRAGPQLGDGSQSESQKPLFRLEDGATLRNVVLGAPAADGIHTYGDATLSDIVWEDIGEDALTIKESGTVVLRGGSARNGDDKVFQVNAASTFRVSDFAASDAGKFIRQNGGTKFKVEVFIERCDIARMGEAIFRTDSSVSTVSMKDTRYSQIGDTLFMGVAPSNVTQLNNQAY